MFWIFFSQLIAMKELAFMLMALCLVSTNAGPFGTMEPSKIRHLMKKTFCEEKKGERVYVREQLETDCSERVKFFEENVSDIVQPNI